VHPAAVRDDNDNNQETAADPETGEPRDDSTFTRSNRYGFGSRSHRWRRQLRHVTGAGCRVLQGRDPDSKVPGLMHVRFGEYHVRDVEFVAAFDVDAKKSASTSRTPSAPARTTPSRSPTCRRPG